MVDVAGWLEPPAKRLQVGVFQEGLSEAKSAEERTTTAVQKKWWYSRLSLVRIPTRSVYMVFTRQTVAGGGIGDDGVAMKDYDVRFVA